MALLPHFWTTCIGSVPHRDPGPICDRLATMLDMPAWPQLPRRNFRENMYVQYSAVLPSLRLDETGEKITFDTTGDLSSALESFYEHYLAGDLDFFGLSAGYAAGFFAMRDALQATAGDWVKGHVTGPISFGLTVTDQALRASLYHEMLSDVIVKNMAMSARWQVRQLKTARPGVLIFVDEPYMASFGSAFISLSREQVIAMLDEVFAGIHEEGGLAGVHCCANTDWSVLLATTVDVLNLDAYGFLENLALYPVELRAFLDRGGVVAWGIVPNDETIRTHTPAQIANRLRSGLKLIGEKATARGIDLPFDLLASRSLVTPTCGLGSASVEIADQVFEVLADTGRLLQQG